MATLNEDSLRRKFQALNNTQDSIQTLSLWIIHHKNHYRQIMELWMEYLKDGKPPMRLTLFYLANDIIQNSKRKGATVFLDSFAEVLEEAASFAREEGIREKVQRIFKIWGERSIYTVEFCNKLQKATVAQKPIKPKARPDPQLLADFNHDEVPEVIEQLARFEGEVELKYRQLGMLSVDVASTETIMQLKDRAGGKRFSQQFEDSAVKLEDYVASLTKEVELRRKLFDLLQKSEIFYEVQFGEAKIVANAYKNFGMRVATLKKRLEEHKALLPDPYSPIPSPTMDAPSPGATPPRDPNSDSIEVEDMELSDEEEDRKHGSIIAASSAGSRRTSRIAAMRNKIAVSASSTSTGISHISTITGAGSHSAFNKSLPSYSPFSTQSPSASYSPSADYQPPMPTSAAGASAAPNAATATAATTSKEKGGEDGNFSSIKDRLLQVMHNTPQLPSSVKLFDSPQRTGLKGSSRPLPPPVSIPSSQALSSSSSRPKGYDQQVSPIITVPPAVPAPVPPQAPSDPPAVDEYDPFESDYSTGGPGYYTPVSGVSAPPLPPSHQPPSPQEEEDDIYDPEMVDYLLEMPLTQKKKPQSSCIIPLTGGFQSPTTSANADVLKRSEPVKSDASNRGSKPATAPASRHPSVKGKRSANGSNSKPGGTPLRDECGTPPTQDENPMLKEATSNPIEFLTKIITSSRQQQQQQQATAGSGGSSKTPAASFLSSLSLLTQAPAPKDTTEPPSQRDAEPGQPAVTSPKFLRPQEDADAPGNPKQNHASDAGAREEVKTFPVTHGPGETQGKGAPSGSDDRPRAVSTPSGKKPIHTNNVSARSAVSFSVGALVSSFKEGSGPDPPSSSAIAPPSVKSPPPVGKAPAAIYHKPGKVPLCQIMNTSAPFTPAVSAAGETHTSSVPSELTDVPLDAPVSAGDNTDAGQSNSLMARMMHNKGKAWQGYTPPPQPPSVSQPSNLAPIILEPPPPPPLPPDESVNVGDSAVPPPLPPPDDQQMPPAGTPPPPSAPPPNGPPLPPSGPPPLPPNIPPPAPIGPPPTQSNPPPPPSIPSTGSPLPPPSGPPPNLGAALLPTHPAPPPTGPPRAAQPPHPPQSPGVPPRTPSTVPTSPVPALSPGIRNATPRMPLRAPPPPPGPPPLSAKRLAAPTQPGVNPQMAPGGQGVPADNMHPLASPQETPLGTPPLSARGPSPPVSPDQQPLARSAAEPSSPIPVLGVRERTIPVVGQAESAKPGWDELHYAPRPRAPPGRYADPPPPRHPAADKYDYAQTQSRPIETLDRNRPPPHHQDRFPAEQPPREIHRPPAQHYDAGRDRYERPWSESGRAGSYDLGRGGRHSHQAYDLDPGYDRDLRHQLNRARRHEPERAAPAPAPAAFEPDFRATQQLIEKELSALAGSEPRGVPISTLGGRMERGRPRPSDYSPPRREDPQYWGPPASKRPAPPGWDRRPPHYRY